MAIAPRMVFDHINRDADDAAKRAEIRAAAAAASAAAASSAVKPDTKPKLDPGASRPSAAVAASAAGAAPAAAVNDYDTTVGAPSADSDAVPDSSGLADEGDQPPEDGVEYGDGVTAMDDEEE